MFNGLGMHMGNLSRLSPARTRSISAENPRGEKGRAAMGMEGTGAHFARNIGEGWKVSPSVVVPAGTTYTVADIEGPGAIQSFWIGGSWGGTSSCAFTGTGRRGRRWKRRSPTFSPFSGRIRTRTAPPGGSPPCNPCRCWWPPTGDTTAFGKCRSVSGAASRWRLSLIHI